MHFYYILAYICPQYLTRFWEQGNMGEGNKITKFLFFSRLFYSLFIVLIITLHLHIMISHRNDNIYQGESIDYSKVWTYENGSLVDFDNLKTDDYFEIKKRTNGDIINTKDLCFYSKNIYFSVYVDDELIYDFHPTPPKLFGKAYGIFPHAITLPVMSVDGTLYIKIDNVYPGSSGFIKDLRLDNGNRFLISELQGSIFEFVLCMIIFVSGMILIFIGTIGRYFGEIRFEIISLATFAMVTALWIAAGTSIISILTGSPIAAHFTNYISLDLLPLPGLLYLSYATGIKNKFFIIIEALSTLLLIVCSMISSALGYQDYHQLLWVTHINLAIAASLMFLILALSVLRKKMTKRFAIMLLVAVFLSLSTGLFDIVRYCSNSYSFEKTSYFKYSAFLFIFFSGIYEFINISEMSRRGQYAEIMEKLAYLDGLTGLLNRKAYNNTLDTASKGSHIYTMIMLDMNYLKKVNDELGHNVGDMYIKKIAEIMNESFVNKEKCFRIGGDEFFVMADYSMSDSLLKSSITTLLSKIEEYNKNSEYNIPLSVAYGVAEFNPEKDNIEEKSKAADENMYKMKTEMKAGRI